ncbi:hypothetical protein COV19_00980 [Candidatus Woesearchaeota archaeon CG10_big_fil_rev_8_21_14_0_10_44_13]|nr:MAG: hypothetical protein COV19_00980 [Candidatus Woesearchaeota archaeon CG10_big_fil_rev_8_21_14_0_10_44_13]
MELLKEVLAGLRPDEKKVKKEIDVTLRKLNSRLRKAKVKAKAVTGGSIAKGTFLEGDYDCDIFVKFNLKKYKDRDLSKILESVLKKSFKNVEKVHGSRDYFHLDRESREFRYEIVPVLDIRKTSEAVNVTDCSPLHVSWVNKFPKMKGEIMLTKAFMKAAGTYGAESYIKGFSGHVVDILTIYYGGFMALLKASQKWKTGDAKGRKEEKEVIDYYNKHKGKALFNLNKSKTESAIVVIDPIQPDRNAAAALNREKFDVFRKKASEFLKNPSKRFFLAEKLDIERLRLDAEQGKGRLILMDAEAKQGKEDVVGAKLLKAFEYIISNLKQGDFVIINKGWEWDRAKRALFWVIVDAKDLPQTKTYEGPPVKIKKHYDNFRKIHKQAYEKGGRVFADEKREFTDAKDLISKLIKEEYIKNRVKSISGRGG